MAEGEGFEPPVPLSTTVFKTVVIDHSTIPPKEKGILMLSQSLFLSTPSGARTLDPLIKSQLLYQLS